MTPTHQDAEEPWRFDTTIPARVSAIDDAMDRIMTAMREAGCARGIESDIDLAVREAIANAVTHGSREDPRKTVKISVAPDWDTLRRCRSRAMKKFGPGPGRLSIASKPARCHRGTSTRTSAFRTSRMTAHSALSRSSWSAAGSTMVRRAGTRLISRRRPSLLTMMSGTTLTSSGDRPTSSSARPRIPLRLWHRTSGGSQKSQPV